MHLCNSWNTTNIFWVRGLGFLLVCRQSLYVCKLVSLAVLSFPGWVYLLQRGVRDAIAGQTEVSHGQVQLFEERHKGPIFGPMIRQYVGDFLSNALQEDSLGDVVAHKLTHSCQICQTTDILQNIPRSVTTPSTFTMKFFVQYRQGTNNLRESTLVSQPKDKNNKERETFPENLYLNIENHRVIYWDLNIPDAVTFKHTETDQWT